MDLKLQLHTTSHMRRDFESPALPRPVAPFANSYLSVDEKYYSNYPHMIPVENSFNSRNYSVLPEPPQTFQALSTMQYNAGNGSGTGSKQQVRKEVVRKGKWTV